MPTWVDISPFGVGLVILGDVEVGEQYNFECDLGSRRVRARVEVRGLCGSAHEPCKWDWIGGQSPYRSSPTAPRGSKMRSTALSTRRVRRFAAALVIALVVAAGGAAATTQSANATITTVATFTTPGTYVWTVPTGVTNATFDVFGARGGSVLTSSGGIVNVVSSGGAGGEAKGKFAVHGGETFEIVVGGQGGTTNEATSAGAAGFNGGGVGRLYAGAGGGGSDVRIGGRGNACAAGKVCGFADRIIVGGGGGGGTGSSGGDGDAGGGLTGGGTICTGSLGSGASASQECPGSSDGMACHPQSFGQFGVGGEACYGNVWGAGGGGWYGGGSLNLGGGGSGYISRFSSSGSFPGGTNAGDGRVIITTT